MKRISNNVSGLTALAVSLLTALAVYADNSPYLTKVWEFVPAPGQFTNVMPEYEQGDDAEAMCRKVEAQIGNNSRGLISLGAWGGYVVFSFDHPVQNVIGEKDFIVEGNAFYASAAQGAAGGGSCEPGIVLVSRDDNGNGLPDDEWYELAGSEYTNPLTKHGYSVTYERTPANHVPTPSTKQKYRVDTTHVHWTDNKGEQGYIEQLSFHKQAYYPMWIDADQLTFTGARLPDNYEFRSNQFYLYPYDYGYADNHPDTAAVAQLDIEWAVREDGTPIHLNEIHFVKVYTALFQQCGTIGETSTEIKGARDLHPNAPAGITATGADKKITKQIRNGQVIIRRNNIEYNPLGTIIKTNY
jgi:hypothetical protein